VGCPTAVETVTIDMAEGYRKAIEERAPQTQIVYDRFHVQRLASDAVDEVRRSQVRDVGAGTEKGQAIKGTRYALLKNPWDLTRKDKQSRCSILFHLLVPGGRWWTRTGRLIYYAKFDA